MISVKAEFPLLSVAVFKLLAFTVAAVSVSTKQVPVDTKFVNVEDVLIVSRTFKLDRLKFEATTRVPATWFSPMNKVPLRIVIGFIAKGATVSVNPIDVGPMIVEALMDCVPSAVVRVEKEIIVLTCETPGAFVPPY